MDTGDNTCDRCNQLQADLDTCEMQHFSDIEQTYEKYKEIENQLAQTKKDFENYQSLHNQDSQNTCYYHLLKIRTDMENLLDCDLPNIENNIENVPEL